MNKKWAAVIEFANHRSLLIRSSQLTKINNAKLFFNLVLNLGFLQLPKTPGYPVLRLTDRTH